MDKQFSPSAARNTEPILAALRSRLPETGRALELASGTGQHIVALVEAFPAVEWTPSDPDAAARASIAAHIREAGLANLSPPLALDVIDQAWIETVEAPLDVMVAINLLHISPWGRDAGLVVRGRTVASAGGPAVHLWAVRARRRLSFAEQRAV